MSKNIFNININIAGKEVLFQTADNQIFCTSLDIANVFEKNHKDVLRAIRKYEQESFNDLDMKIFHQRNFTQTYKETQIRGFNKVEGRIRKDPFYKLTRDGFSFLTMSFTGAKANRWKVAFINAFNKLEVALREQQRNYVLEDTKELFNLKQKTPCRSYILEEVKTMEQKRKSKCNKIVEYKITETFCNGIVKINSEVIVEFDKPTSQIEAQSLGKC